MWKSLFKRILPEEKINTWKHAIKITISVKSLLSIEFFSIKNLDIKVTTNNPAIGWKADSTIPDIMNK